MRLSESSRQQPAALPFTNRGALTPPRTEGEARPEVLIDWCEGTFPDGTDPRSVLPLANQEAWVELPAGGYKYPCSLALGRVRVYYGGAPGMGVHLVMSGQACREAEGLGLIGGYARLLPQEDVGRDGCLQEECSSEPSARPPDWPAFCRSLRKRGWQPTRGDGALRDVQRTLDLDRMRADWDAGRAVSRWKKMDPRRPTEKGGVATGYTLYFGSPRSETRLRVYDKDLEQKAATGTYGIQVELQLRREAADRFFALVEERDPAQFGQLLAELIAGRLRFIERTATRVERCPTADYWAAFLGYARRRCLGSEPRIKTLEEADHWLDHSVMPVLAVSFEASGGDLGKLVERLRAGRSRWGPRHAVMLTGVA